MYNSYSTFKCTFLKVAEPPLFKKTCVKLPNVGGKRSLVLVKGKKKKFEALGAAPSMGGGKSAGKPLINDKSVIP